jgi:hypothetical protein
VQLGSDLSDDVLHVPGAFLRDENLHHSGKEELDCNEIEREASLTPNLVENALGRSEKALPLVPVPLVKCSRGRSLGRRIRRRLFFKRARIRGARGSARAYS